jgi:hypothetical protein
MKWSERASGIAKGLLMVLGLISPSPLLGLSQKPNIVMLMTETLVGMISARIREVGPVWDVPPRMLIASREKALYSRAGTDTRVAPRAAPRS